MFRPFKREDQYEWRNIVDADRRQSNYGQKRKTRTVGQWLFFVPDWNERLYIVAFFDRPWPTRASQHELAHLLEKAPPSELARCFVYHHHAKTYSPLSWLVLEKDPRHRGDPVVGNNIWHLSWGKRPPLREAGKLLRAKVLVADAATRLGWSGEIVLD